MPQSETEQDPLLDPGIHAPAARAVRLRCAEFPLVQHPHQLPEAGQALGVEPLHRAAGMLLDPLPESHRKGSAPAPSFNGLLPEPVGAHQAGRAAPPIAAASPAWRGRAAGGRSRVVAGGGPSGEEPPSQRWGAVTRKSSAYYSLVGSVDGGA